MRWRGVSLFASVAYLDSNFLDYTNAPGLPGYIALAPSLKSDIWGAGHMGSAYEPVDGSQRRRARDRIRERYLRR